MPSQITNYQCPNCTGPLRFDGASGKLVCDYCDSTYTVEEVEALFEGKNEAAEAAAANFEQQALSNEIPGEWDMDQAGSDWGADAARMRAYNCPSCGAELICDSTTAAMSCPYCGNPTIVPGQLGGTKKPDVIIPFKMDKQAAIAALQQHYKGKRLLPKAFAEASHLEEIKGVYVPFWLFDARVDARMSFNTTRTHTHTSSTEIITETDHFVVQRGGSIRFQSVPVDGSTKMPDAHMDAIEPFDYSDLRPFSLSYLPGFLADKYDVSQDESRRRADARVRQSAEQAVRNTVDGYETCTTTFKDLRVFPERVRYALLPVWMLSTQWNGQNFLFAMNGQTGKLIGDLPVDKKKLAMWCAGIFAGVTGLFALITAIL